MGDTSVFGWLFLVGTSWSTDTSLPVWLSLSLRCSSSTCSGTVNITTSDRWWTPTSRSTLPALWLTSECLSLSGRSDLYFDGYQNRRAPQGCRFMSFRFSHRCKGEVCGRSMWAESAQKQKCAEFAEYQTGNCSSPLVEVPVNSEPGHFCPGEIKKRKQFS